jgi:hypothetical protein
VCAPVKSIALGLKRKRQCKHGPCARGCTCTYPDLLRHIRDKRRYVTRQGQGGRQSTQDKSGKYANSMGSQLRRANEASLERNIVETLTAWQSELAACDLLFVHAPSANAKAVFGNGALSRQDARMRRIPFTTARPTLKEARRCMIRLAEVAEVEEPVARAQREAHPAKARAAGGAERTREAV